MRVATYTRVSTARQDDGEKTSLTEQSAACDAYAAAHGWQIVSRFTDVGSGADRERPGFKAVLDAVRGGTVGGVLAWKPDRLYRALGPAADLADALEAVKAEFHSVQDSVDAKNLPLYAAVAAMERAGIKERMTLGKVGAAKAGKIPVSRPPFGYRRGDEDRRPLIVEKEAALVQRIFTEYVSGRGLEQIAQGLTFDAIPTPSAYRAEREGNGAAIPEKGVGHWHKSVVGRILHEPAYGGSREYSGVAVDFPPIVEREVFERARALIRRRRSQPTGHTRHNYSLQSKVECLVCGRRFIARTKNGVSPNPIRYYVCGGSPDGAKCRKTRHVRAERLEALVWGLLADLLLDPAMIRAVVETATEPDTLDNDITQIERDVARVNRETDALTRSYMRGTIDEARFDRLAAEQGDKLAAHREKLGTLKRQRQDAASTATAVGAVEQWAREIADTLPTLAATEKREIVQRHVEKVSIDGPGNVKVTFSLPVSVESHDLGKA